MNAKAKDNSVAPVVVNDHCWIYGERDGLCVVHEDREIDGTLNQTRIVTIPWGKIMLARDMRPR